MFHKTGQHDASICVNNNCASADFSDLHEEVYVSLPLRYSTFIKESGVRLPKSLHG